MARLSVYVETSIISYLVGWLHPLLVTWNCRHIANASILPLVYDVCRVAGYKPPLICTPHELIEELPNV